MDLGPQPRRRFLSASVGAMALVAVVGTGCARVRTGVAGHQPDGTAEVLSVTSPPDRLVYQRSLAGSAMIPVAGTCPWRGAFVEARLSAKDGRRHTATWVAVGVVGPDGRYRGQLTADAGWYGLEVRARSREGAVRTAGVDRVGVGEVFVVVGHSVAQGGDINLPGATDDRVNTIALPPDQTAREREYERTGEARHLPAPVGARFSTGVRPAPFGHGTYFWARFAERVAQAQDVPVLLLNAAFGGTSLEHWAKSARGEPFAHPFVKADIQMPYINLRNALRRYAAVTGIRAVLADQGQNDWTEPDAEVVAANYRTWVEQARRDLGHPGLAVVVNRQTPFGGRSQIRRAQERMIRENPGCFPGPDYDRMTAEDRPDRIHLSATGAEKAARLWAESLGPDFFRQAVPYQPLPGAAERDDRGVTD